MAISRRQLIKTGALAGAAGLLPRLAAGQSRVQVAVGPAAAAAASWPTRSTFAAQVDSLFGVRSGSLRLLRLRLSSVADLPSAKTNGTSNFEETFALYFEGPGSLRLSQGTQRLSHPVLGDLQIFLVPVERPGKLQTYEAVFNRQAA